MVGSKNASRSEVLELVGDVLLICACVDGLVCVLPFAEGLSSHFIDQGEEIGYNEKEKVERMW